jgi:hypothetical protein
LAEPSPTPRRFTRAHAWVALTLLALFTALTAWATGELLSADAGDPPHEHALHVALTAVSTPLGPFTGAIAREFHSGCLANSMSLLPYAAALLAAGVLPQLLPPASARPWRVLRLVVWALGWFAWFASGILSLGHALE